MFKIRRFVGVIVSVCLMLGLLSGSITSEAKDTKSKNYGTATLRIFSTNDLHGQATSYSYDSASYHKNGSLAQIATVIDQKKKELKYGNSLLVDCGDIIFGMGAEAIQSGKISGTQYMFKIMKKMGYDAITLGNHDFDFGFDYIKTALEDTGMDSKVVLANVRYAKSGRHPWIASKIIAKSVKTNKNKKRKIKIGLMGVTVPQLSNVYSWKDLLTTSDIIDEVKIQSADLKRKGADIVVVLAHSGLGAQGRKEDKEPNVAYYLTKLSNVDVVLGGHEHRAFPGDDPRMEQYNYYPGVSKQNKGVVNGKVLTESLDHGVCFGISDLKLKFVGDKVKVVGREVQQRYITENDAESSLVTGIMRKYDKGLRELYDEEVAKTKKESNNYFGMIEDNLLIQLANEAKIYYGKQIVENELPEYKKYPVIAGTAYNAVGRDGADDYIDAGSEIKYRDVLNIQSYGKQLTKTYYITGKQLKELLEWKAASIYLTPGEQQNAVWKDTVINDLVRNRGVVPVLNPEGEDWMGFMVFDGIEYTIDPTILPRYDKVGKKIINDTHRITSITCNGKTVSDDQIFVFVSEGITEQTMPPIGAAVSKQLLYRHVEHISDVLKNYIDALNEAGDIVNEEDDNWEISFPEGNDYLIKSSAAAFEKAKCTTWYVDYLGENNGYGYYQAKLGGPVVDNKGPFLVASPKMTKTSGDPYDILIQASDRSGGVSVKAYKGRLLPEDSAWSYADYVHNNSYTVIENGVYSFMAQDSKGNRTVKYVSVNNINNSVATAPKIKKVKNTNQYVKGYASSGSTVYVKCKAGTFSVKVGNDGYFECSVAYFKADEKIAVWQVDTFGRISEQTEATVLRSGANMPLVDDITNKKDVISGVLNDSRFCSIAVVRGDNVYIPKGEKSKYKASEVSSKNKGKHIVEATYKYNDSNNTFSIKVPRLYANQKIKVYSYDWISRSSRVNRISVRDVAPNQPVLDSVFSEENIVYGRVPGAKVEEYKIKVTVGDEEFYGTTDSKGRFVVGICELDKGEKIKVNAIDYSQNGKQRISMSQSANAESLIDEYDKDNTSLVKFDAITNKDNTIVGKVVLHEGETSSLIIGDTKAKAVFNEDGTFEYALSKTRKPGTVIGLMIRNHEGEVIALNYKKVKLAVPDAPEFVTDLIDEDTTRIKIRGVDEATAVLKVGSKKYKAVKIKKGNGHFYYVFKVKKLKPGKKVVAYLKNKAGKSSAVVFGVVEEVEELEE